MKKIKLNTGVFEYETKKPLGRRGGFGQVFAGRTGQGELVAIKRLHVSGEDAAHRELRIAEELKGRSFEYVIPYIDSGEDADTGGYFVVMPRASYSLQYVINEKGVMSASDAASVLLQIARGLQEIGELCASRFEAGQRLASRRSLESRRPRDRSICRRGDCK